MWAGLQAWNFWLPSVQEDIYKDQWHADSVPVETNILPTTKSKTLESEQVSDVLMRVCWIPIETRPPLACNSLDSNNQTVTDTRCKDFRCSWTCSCLCLFTTTVYSRSAYRHRHHVLFAFDITSDVFPCTPSEDDLTQATVLLYVYSPKYLCTTRNH